MKRYFSVFILILVAVFSLSLAFRPVRNTLGIVRAESSPLDAVFETTGGELSDIQILAWGKLNSQYMTVEEMKNTLAIIKKTFYNGQGVPEFHIEENYKSCIVDAGVKGPKNVRILLQTYQPAARASSFTPESYLLVEITQTDSNFTLAELKKEVSSIYKKFNATPEMTITYTAKVKGKITSTDADACIKKVEKILSLTDVQEVAANDFYSVTGYSKLFPQELILAGHKRNFTLNIRYNLEDDQTYVVFGTPDIGGQE